MHELFSFSKQLLQHSITIFFQQPNLCDSAGETSLMKAVDCDSYEVAEYLLRQGKADPTIGFERNHHHLLFNFFLFFLKQ